MEASSGLAGIVVENAESNGKEFDGIWVSSLCDSAWRGKPDNEVVDFTDRLHTIQEILEVTTKPLIIDGDTGGRTEHFTRHVKTLECLGVSAVVIEDKKGLKQNSLLEDIACQILEDKAVFADKIRQGKAALSTGDFMIFARIESFIAGGDLTDALDRARAYTEAGADGIMIHSRQKNGKEIREFLEAFRKEKPEVVTMVVPTAYDSFREDELSRLGAGIIIYANQLLRSAYHAMKLTAECILKEGRGMEAGQKYCVPLEEILNITGD